MEHGFATKRSALAILMLVASAAAVMLACTGGPGGATTVVLKPSTVKVDDHIKPPITSIPGSNGGPAATVAALSLAGDHALASFVEDRLVVSTSSSSDLQAFLNRWGGTVLDSVNMQAAGLGQTPNLYLVTINPSKASPDALPQDLQKINAKQRADLLVSSDSGRRTLAAAVREAATSHLTVGLDWLALPADEAPNGNGALGGAIPYDTHAANWPYMNRGSAQDIGVVAAWGLVGPSAAHVKVAILDGGFCSTPELPAGAQFFPATPTCQTNPWPDSDGSRDDFHGTQTAETAFGLANNGQGAAGIAGLVAQPVLVRSPQPDLFAIINYLVSTLPSALSSGARILNISAGLAIPGPLSFAAAPVSAFFGNLRANGILTFVSAGNDGVDVNAQDCFVGVCWQKKFWVPCQNSGVICVGGLAVNATRHASGSNFSTRGDIPIYAPFDVWTLGATNGDVQTTAAHSVSGTSFSSPFVAGVAALIWAINPSLSASQVQTILLTTAHTGSPDPVVPRWVNAFAAVVAAQPAPQVTITQPANGTHFFVGQSATLQVRAIEPTTGRFLPDSAITWTVNGSPLPTHASLVTLPLTSAGTETIGASATNEAGVTASATPVTITVDAPPPVTIIAPTEGQIIYAGSDGTLDVTITAANTDGWSLTWTDESRGGMVLSHQPSFTVHLGTLNGNVNCNSNYTVTLTATLGSSTVVRTVHFTLVTCIS